MSTAIRVDVTRADTKLTVSLSVLDCANCGVIFAIGDEFDRRRREDGRAFYCPNGHSQSYAGEISQLRSKLKQAEEDRNWYMDAERRAADERDRVQRSLTATRGAVTRLRKRAQAGTCPYGCRRHFANVERHVERCHPDKPLEGES